jgi:hypothetical protein
MTDKGDRGDPGPRGRDGLAQPAKVIRSFWLLVLVATLVLALEVIPIVQNRHTAQQGQRAHDALCALNQRNIDRIASSKRFLREHPNGIPGIPTKLISDGIKADQSTVNVLTRTLGDCTAPTPP